MKRSPTANVYWRTRERVIELLETHLVTRDVLPELLPYVLSNRLFVPPNRIDVVPTAPEVLITILVLEIRVTVEDHKTAL